MLIIPYTFVYPKIFTEGRDRLNICIGNFDHVLRGTFVLNDTQFISF